VHLEGITGVETKIFLGQKWQVKLKTTEIMLVLLGACSIQDKFFFWLTICQPSPSVGNYSSSLKWVQSLLFHILEIKHGWGYILWIDILMILCWNYCHILAVKVGDGSGRHALLNLFQQQHWFWKIGQGLSSELASALCRICTICSCAHCYGWPWSTARLSFKDEMCL